LTNIEEFLKMGFHFDDPVNRIGTELGGLTLPSISRLYSSMVIEDYDADAFEILI